MEARSASAPVKEGLGQGSQAVRLGFLGAFDLWQEPGAGLSFAGGETIAAPRWRLDLGDDPAGAHRRLAALEAQTRQVQSRLDAVPGRLDDLLRRTASGPDAEVSFSATAVSGPGEDLAEAERDLTAATRRLSRLLTHVAWVETRAGGQLLGQTVVGWSGKMRTAWNATADPEWRTLHQRNVAVALASRLGLLRTMVVVAHGAATLSMLLSTGGIGAATALPAAWRFVQQVLAEVKTR